MHGVIAYLGYYTCMHAYVVQMDMLHLHMIVYIYMHRLVYIYMHTYIHAQHGLGMLACKCN